MYKKENLNFLVIFQNFFNFFFLIYFFVDVSALMQQLGLFLPSDMLNLGGAHLLAGLQLIGEMRFSCPVPKATAGTTLSCNPSPIWYKLDFSKLC